MYHAGTTCSHRARPSVLEHAVSWRSTLLAVLVLVASTGTEALGYGGRSCAVIHGGYRAYHGYGLRGGYRFRGGYGSRMPYRSFRYGYRYSPYRYSYGYVRPYAYRYGYYGVRVPYCDHAYSPGPCRCGWRRLPAAIGNGVPLEKAPALIVDSREGILWRRAASPTAPSTDKPAAGVAPDAPPPDASQLDEGLRALEAGETRTALSRLSRAMLSDPSSAPVRLAYADALLASGAFLDAATSLRRGMEALSRREDLVARRQHFASDAALHVPELRELVQQHSEHADTRLLLAYALALGGDFVAAGEELHRLLEVAVDDPDAARLLSLVEADD